MDKVKEKIVYFENIDKKLKNKNLKMVLCHGHFDLIHPGHLRFLDAARALGSKLIVALYTDDYYEAYDKKNHFSVEERAKNLSYLETVSKIIIIHPNKLHLLLKNFEFTYFAIGKEFIDQRKDEISLSIKIASMKKTKIKYLSGDINYEENFRVIQDDIKIKKWKELKLILDKRNISLKNILTKINKPVKTNIIIIGDIIIDKYVNCIPIGMSEEAPLVVVKEIDDKLFIGGAGIVSQHIKSMKKNPYLLSVCGNDEYYDKIKKELKFIKIRNKIFKDKDRMTTLKTRYIVDKQKLFRVSKLDENPINEDLEKKILRIIENNILKTHILIVSDFVYGVITDNIIDKILKLRKKYNFILIGDLQCSSQLGDASKFLNFDLICSTEKEARIALMDNVSGIEHIANRMLKKTNSMNFILKLGGEGFILYSRGKKTIKRIHYPALEPNPVDKTGAGDTLLASMAVALNCELDIESSAAFAACASALAVQKLGNTSIALKDLEIFINKNNLY